MTVETFKKVIAATKSPSMQEHHHKFFTDKGLTHYQHGQDHGWLDKKGKSLRVTDVMEHANKHGYKPGLMQGGKVMGGRQAWSFYKDAGPHHTHHLDMDSENGAHVRNANYRLGRED